MKKDAQYYNNLLYKNDDFSNMFWDLFIAYHMNFPTLMFDENRGYYVSVYPDSHYTGVPYYTIMTIEPINDNDFHSHIQLGTFDKNDKFIYKYTVAEIAYINGKWNLVPDEEYINFV